MDAEDGDRAHAEAEEVIFGVAVCDGCGKGGSAAAGGGWSGGLGILRGGCGGGEVDGAREEGDGAGAGGDLLRLVGDGGGVDGAAGNSWGVEFHGVLLLVLRFSVDINGAEDGERGEDDAVGGAFHAAEGLGAFLFRINDGGWVGSVAPAQVFGRAIACRGVVCYAAVGGEGEEASTCQSSRSCSWSARAHMAGHQGADRRCAHHEEPDK